MKHSRLPILHDDSKQAIHCTLHSLTYAYPVPASADLDNRKSHLTMTAARTAKRSTCSITPHTTVPMEANLARLEQCITHTYKHTHHIPDLPRSSKPHTQHATNSMCRNVLHAARHRHVQLGSCGQLGSGGQLWRAVDS